MERKPPKDMLDWMGVTDAPRWWLARPLGGLVAMVLTLLFIGTLVAAFVLIGGTIFGGGGAGGNLGTGALIVALLGAPFLIWSTVLKHQTLRYQKEGHITDRINKAVEQLGAEKTVERRGRTLFFSVGDEKHSAFEYDDEPFTYPPDATEIKQREWVQMKRTEPTIEVRIGAILSLERIAQDSTNHDNGRDHVRVMEILCAYVRQNAPARDLSTHGDLPKKPLSSPRHSSHAGCHIPEGSVAVPWPDFVAFF